LKGLATKLVDAMIFKDRVNFFFEGWGGKVFIGLLAESNLDTSVFVPDAQ
jgi:hypothetical protein